MPKVAPRLVVLSVGLVLLGLVGFRALFAAGYFQTTPPILVGPVLESSTTDGASGQSSLWVLWETPLNGIPQAEVQYGLTEAALTLSATGMTTATAGDTHMHEVQLAGLTPFTKYFYRVRNGAGAADFSAIFSFVTPPLPASNQEFTFVTTSDEQPGEGNPTFDRIIARRVTAEIVPAVCGTAAECPDKLALLLSAGDNADQGGNYNEYKPWFDSRQVLQERVASVVTLGNHDYYLDELEVRNWRGYHHFPTNGRLSVAFGLPDDPAYLPRFDERWYFIDYSNVRFIVLDSNGYSGPGIDQTGDLQNAWLDELLNRTCTAENIDFVVTMMHHTHHFDEILPTDHVPNTKAITDRTEQFSTDCNKPTVHLYGHSHHYNRGHARNHHATFIDAATSGGNVESYDPSVSQDFAEALVSQATYGFVRADVTAGETPSIRFRRYSIGFRPNGDTESQGVIDDFMITLSDNKPLTPTAVAATVQGAAVQLQGSVYSDPEGIAQQSAQWQVSTVSGDFSNPLFDHLANFKNIYRGIDTQAGADLTQAEFRDFAANTTYFWRVRYRNQHNHWSAWSAESTFTTTDAGALFRTAKDAYTGGEPIVVEWAGFPGNTNDWVALSPVGAPDNALYGNFWHFTSGAKGGSYTFSGLPEGSYEARAYYNWPAGGYTVQARHPFQVTGTGISVITDKSAYNGAEPIVVNWANLPGNVFDLVSIAPQGSPADTRLDNYWTYLNGDVRGAFVFPPQPVSGNYEARAFVAGETTPVAVAAFSVAGLVTPTPTATVPGQESCLYQEGFEGLPLQAAVSETIPSTILGWTHTPPNGWAVTNGAGMPRGVTEWQGWSFATLAFWTAADLQDRGNFTRASGAFAIADPDEWDDQGSPASLGQFDSALTSPPINVTGVNTVTINFDSHFRQEAPQKAQVTVAFDGGAEVEVLRYDENPTSANGGADAQNRAVSIAVAAPAGATNLVIKWRLFEAGNNWFWAIDNVDIRSDAPLTRVTQCFDPNATPTPTATPSPTPTETPLPTPSPTPDPANVLLNERFEGLTLNAAVDEIIGPILGWTHTGPAGWTIDNSKMPPQTGTTEWQGWSFATLAFWAGIAPGQDRERFTLAQDILVVSDPDEWDDTNGAAASGEFDSTLLSPPITVTGRQAVQIDFDSHYRQEAIQTASLVAAFDNGQEVELLRYDDQATSDNGGQDVQNKHVSLTAAVPSGANSVTLKFRLYKARNNWYWAIDNLTVTAVTAPSVKPLPFSENFESLTGALQAAVSETIPSTILGWTHTPPTDWTRANAPEMPRGVTEWQGWSFTTLPFWTAADVQDREKFSKASGVFAVADPDEWDDQGSPASLGQFNSWLTTPPLAVAGLTAVKVSFDSHYRQEAPQVAVVLASFDGGAPQEILRYDATNADDLAQQNLHLDLRVPVPAGAQALTLSWQLKEAGNNWFWAIDNLQVTEESGPTGPTQLIISHDAQPNSMVDFRYQGGLGDFRLDDITPDDGDVYTNTKHFLVEPGAYWVTQWTPRGWMLADLVCDPAAGAVVNRDAGSITVTLADGAQVTCTLRNERLITLRTRVYHDVNADGRRDQGDQPQAGWTVTIYNGAGVAVGSAVTNELGKANFNHLPKGTYTICETLQAGWTNNLPGALDPTRGKPCYTVTVESGLDAYLYFGNLASGATASVTAAADSGVRLVPALDTGNDAGYEEVFVDTDLTTPDNPSSLYLPILGAEAR